jgi:hypothetical protein
MMYWCVPGVCSSRPAKGEECVPRRSPYIIELADHTVDAYVAAIGRRLPTRQFEHNTLLGGPPDFAVSLAVIIPDAMA